MVIVPSLHLRKNFSQVLSEVLQLDLETFPKERPTRVKMPKLHLEDHVDLSGALTQLGERRPDRGWEACNTPTPAQASSCCCC